MIAVFAGGVAAGILAAIAVSRLRAPAAMAAVWSVGILPTVVSWASGHAYLSIACSVAMATALGVLFARAVNTRRAVRD